MIGNLSSRIHFVPKRPDFNPKRGSLSPGPAAYSALDFNKPTTPSYKSINYKVRKRPKT